MTRIFKQTNILSLFFSTFQNIMRTDALLIFLIASLAWSNVSVIIKKIPGIGKRKFLFVSLRQRRSYENTGT